MINRGMSWLSFATSIAVTLFTIIAFPRPAIADEPASIVDQNTWPKNDLEKLLVGATEAADQRPAFIAALLTSRLCALTDKSSEASVEEGKETGGIKLLGYKAEDGQPAAPLFTSPERVAETIGSGTPYVCAKGATLLTAARQTRVVIDPGEPYGIMFTPDELDHILGTERILNTSTKVQLGVPQQIPVQLVEKLKTTLGAESEISAAWLALAYWPDQKEWTWYLDVRTKLDRAQVQNLLRDATINVDMLGKPMDVVVNDPSAPAGTGLPIVQR